MTVIRLLLSYFSVVPGNITYYTYLERQYSGYLKDLGPQEP